MFKRSTQDSNTEVSKHQVNQDINRGLALLILLAVSIVGSSWLLSLPVYFNLKIIAQVFPLLVSAIILLAVSHYKHLYLNIIAPPLSYLFIFSSWSYVIYLNTVNINKSVTDLTDVQLIGMSNSMYLLGLCLLTVWLARYFKCSIYLSSASIISLIAALQLFTVIDINILIASLLLLASTTVISSIGFKHKPVIDSSQTNTFNQTLAEDMLLPEDVEEVTYDDELITPELVVNTLPLSDSSLTHDWELILRELQGELKHTPDVDQLFKRMLVFLHGAMEFDSAAVGMQQDKNIKRIALYGDDEYLHTQSLNWTSQRIKEVFSLKEPVLSQQTHASGNGSELTEPLHRLDVPIISGQKVVGVVSVFRETLLFDTHDVKLASSIVFHSMIALRLSRLQDEVKRLSSDATPAKLTLYTREQFLSKVKPVLAKIGKPRECSLFIVEIDNLDTITDTVGREAGASLHKAVSKVIMSQLREHDLLGTYGKEGYIVLLDETDMNHAKSVAENIRVKASQLKLRYQSSVITTTISVGLTIVSDQDEDLPSLMRKADMGLFVAKENGCNTIKVSF